MKGLKQFCVKRSQILIAILLVIGSFYIFREPLSKVLDNDARCK